MANKPTIRAVCMELDGRIIALGGVVLDRGRWLGFADFTVEARLYRMHIMRAAIRFLDALRADGICYVYAVADPNEPRAMAWLSSLGFSIDHRTQYFLRWSGKDR